MIRTFEPPPNQHLIYFVENVDTGDVNPVPLDYINQIVTRAVFLQDYIGITDTVFAQNLK
jgi:hypothetical protein